jgi:hypothetical protein
MSSFKRAVEPYLIPIDVQEGNTYSRLRIKPETQASAPAARPIHRTL